eukprot:m.55043 g.55043  ORF g.55043 m.55043 type:complete len:828 (+) comp22015_c0_seq1:144-2627(+)
MSCSMSAIVFGLCAMAISAVASNLYSPPPTPPPTVPIQEFGFGFAFGDDMVLQRAPAKAAVYGFTSPGAKSVKVTVYSEGKELYSVDAAVGTNATHQPFGESYGVRPCPKESCPKDDMAAFNPWNQPQVTWKALLQPTPATANGPPQSYNITAVCDGCTGNVTSETIHNVVFGDLWYCSGQSNIWLPVRNTFSRNETLAAIQAGKYNNIHAMFGVSGNDPAAGIVGKSSTTYNVGGQGYGRKNGSNPWMTAKQAILNGTSMASGGNVSLFAIGASCWYFGQRLSELGVTVPIGLANTAIGGQRIEEYMPNNTINKCQNRTGEATPWWNAQLYGQQVLPFVDMTVKGWVWYQGENNMGGLKGSSLENLGYSCEQRELIRGWREVWSETPGTTDPMAPFGLVSLASSGAEGNDAAMGAMRVAQTAGYGVLPSPELPNTFFAQAYDLDDQWGPIAGPCFAAPEKGGFMCCDANGSVAPPAINPPTPSNPDAPLVCNASDWRGDITITGGKQIAINGSTSGQVDVKHITDCCDICSNTTFMQLGCQYWMFGPKRDGGYCEFYTTLGTIAKTGGTSTYGGIRPFGPDQPPPPPTCNATTAQRCATACAAAFNTPSFGSIHPRDKKPVGDRLGQAAYNLVYGGGGALAGPTLSGCSLAGSTLTIKFNTSLLLGDSLVLQKYSAPSPGYRGALVGGTFMDVQTNPSDFCIEPAKDVNGNAICPTWAGGTGLPINTSTTQLDGGWIRSLPINMSADGSSIVVDLSVLNGTVPSAVRYAWSIVNCCDLHDPDTYVTKPCGPAACPIMSSSKLPANPFLAKIVDGKCACLPPQVCDE